MRKPNFEEQQNIEIRQARRMKIYKESEEFQLFYNTFMVMKKIATDERMRAMKLNSTRENCLYYTGYEDGITKCLDAIDQIVINGELIQDARDEMEQAQEANSAN